MKYEAASLRTKRALAESLKKLMRRKALSKITVTEIVADCGVNRKTFYYHFEDIYDLLRWIFEEEAVKIIHGYYDVDEPEEAIGFTLDYVSENLAMLKNAYDAFGSVELENFFLSSLNGLTRQVVEKGEHRMGKRLPESLKDYLCEFLTEATSGMLLSYISGTFPFDRQKTITFVSLIVRTAIKGLLDEQGIPEDSAAILPEQN